MNTAYFVMVSKLFVAKEKFCVTSFVYLIKTEGDCHVTSQRSWVQSSEEACPVWSCVHSLLMFAWVYSGCSIVFLQSKKIIVILNWSGICLTKQCRIMILVLLFIFYVNSLYIVSIFQYYLWHCSLGLWWSLHSYFIKGAF